MYGFNQTLKTRNAWSAPEKFGIVLIGLLVWCSTALGQAGSKESQKFLEYSEDASESVADMRSRLEKTIAYYNDLVLGTAKKPESTYKDLNKSLGKTEKLADKVRGQVDKMQGQSAKVFSAWEEELEGYQSEDMRRLAAERLEVTKQRYDQMIERMTAAAAAYDPLITSLRDQALFMGRDLSPEAMGTLAKSAEELNQLAEELYARIAELLDKQVADEEDLKGEDEVKSDT
jgi:hypothetical protein